MAGAGLNHWILHNDRLAHEFDETLKLTPGYDPVRDVDTNLVFLAPLICGVESIPGNLSGIVGRNSEANYWAARGGFLLAAGDNESRHEWNNSDQPLGYLAELAETNKCLNFNADPDQALSGILGNGADVLRVKREADLHEAGLSALCTSGYVVRLENNTGAAVYPSILGEAGNLNPHICSVWLNTFGDTVGWGLSGDRDPVVSEYELARIIVAKTPTAGTQTLSFELAPGQAVEFILNKLAEASIVSSDIVTQGAPSSRAVDQLFYPLAGAPLGWQILTDPGFDNPDQWTTTAQVTIANSLCTFLTTAANQYAVDQGYDDIKKGHWYRVRVSVPRMDTGRFQIRIYDETLTYAASGFVDESGLHEFLIHADGSAGAGSFSSAVFIFADFSINDFDIDYIEVNEATVILNASEGMLAIVQRYPWSGADIAVGHVQRIITLDGPTWIYAEKIVGPANTFRCTDAALNTASVTIDGDLQADTEYLILLRWGGAELQIGYKQGGVVRWGAPAVYGGAFEEGGLLHVAQKIGDDLASWSQLLHLWDVDRGTDWLESEFREVAS